MREVCEVRERAHQREREPVARRLRYADLLFNVAREVRQGVALLHPPLVRDLLVAAREGDGLERDEGDLLRVVEREAYDRADLVVVDAVDERDDQNDLDARLVQVVNRAQLHVEEVADLAVRVGVVADAVEL